MSSSSCEIAVTPDDLVPSVPSVEFDASDLWTETSARAAEWSWSFSLACYNGWDEKLHTQTRRDVRSESIEATCIVSRDVHTVKE